MSKARFQTYHLQVMSRKSNLRLQSLFSLILFHLNIIQFIWDENRIEMDLNKGMRNKGMKKWEKEERESEGEEKEGKKN